MHAWFGYSLARHVGEAGVVDIVTNGLWAEEPGVLAMAKQYEELATLGYISPYIATNVWPQGQNVELALGEAAMYLNGTWLPNEVSEIAGPDFNWGFFSYPSVPGGVDESKLLTMVHKFMVSTRALLYQKKHSQLLKL